MRHFSMSRDWNQAAAALRWRCRGRRRSRLDVAAEGFGMRVRRMAARTEPVMEPWPPTMTMATISMERMKRKDSD